MALECNKVMLGICVEMLALTVPGTALSQVTTPSQPAASQAPAGEQDSLESVVVTATRVSQSDQSVPLSLTAVGAAQLAREGITSTSQLGTLAPSLFVLSSVSEGSPRYTMRGLTGLDVLPAGAPAVATYIDDIYQASQYGIASSLFDLQRIEVLRGPQGTTFGKNTTGGAVAYFSQTPTQKLEGYVSGTLSGGDQGQRSIEGAVNVPIIQGVLAMRFSGRIYDKGNWVYDPDLGRKIGEGHGDSGRLQFRWTPTDTTLADLKIFGDRWRGEEPLTHGQIVPAPVDPRVISLNTYGLHDDFNNGGVTLRIEQTIGSFNLTSLTHLRKSRYDTAQDLDGTDQDIFFYLSNSLTRQYGQELRLTSDPTRRVSGLAGLYFEHDHVDETANEAALIQDDFNDISYYLTNTRTYAAFGNLKVAVIDGVSFVGGLRKTQETREQEATKLLFQGRNYPWTRDNIVFYGPPPLTPDQALIYSHKVKSTPWTWDATLNYNPDSALLIFGRVAKGFRSGGFNPANTVFGPGQLPLPVPPPFQPEEVLSYEVGFKSTWWNNRLKINGSGYHYNYTDQQVTEYFVGQPVTENAGKSAINGGELEVAANPDAHWMLRGNASYTDARYTSYVLPFIGADYSGKTLAQAPKWMVGANVSYQTPLTSRFDLRGTLGWTFRTRVFYDSSNDPYLTDGSLSTGTVRLALEPNGGQGISVAAFANNITNQRRLSSGFPFFPGYYLKFFDPGRSYGVNLAYHW